MRVDERATIEDVANHWWVNWGFEESVCDCPSAPHQECPSPLLARYIDWQNRVAATSNMTVDPGCLSSDSSCPPHLSPHPFYFSLPLKSDRGGGGGGGGESPSGRIQQGRRQHGKGSRNTRRTWPSAKSCRLTQHFTTTSHTSSLWLRLTGLCAETSSLCLMHVNSANTSRSDAVRHDNTLTKPICAH